MEQAQIYEGTFEEIKVRYGKELANRRIKVTVEAIENIGAAKRPFYETATAEEWAKEWRTWAASHDNHVTPLSEEAIDRDSIYEGRG